MIIEKNNHVELNKSVEYVHFIGLKIMNLLI